MLSFETAFLQNTSVGQLLEVATENIVKNSCSDNYFNLFQNKEHVLHAFLYVGHAFRIYLVKSHCKI